MISHVIQSRIEWRACLTVCVILISSGSVKAQQTIFNVPSGDVLKAGSTYTELDVTYRRSDRSLGFTPRIVFGVGHKVEMGLNLNGLNTQGELQTVIAPTLKWKAYDGDSNGWAFLIGDDVFVPVQNRAYDAGNYSYAEVTKTWSRTKTRVTLGAFHFTPGVVAGSGHRAGGQFALEQSLGGRATLAVDWYTGDHALGYASPGIIIRITPKLTWYATYQIGNRGVAEGNHQVLTELGYNLK